VGERRGGSYSSGVKEWEGGSRAWTGRACYVGRRGEVGSRVGSFSCRRIAMFYRVKWSVTRRRTAEVREYIASRDDAWELWNYLTTRAAVEPEYVARQVEQRTESALFGYEPPIVEVKVYEIGGLEVCPEGGLAGMSCHKEARS
jgi:hypothetical protein